MCCYYMDCDNCMHIGDCNKSDLVHFADEPNCDQFACAVDCPLVGDDGGWSYLCRCIDDIFIH